MSNKGSTRLGENPTVAYKWGVLQIVQVFVDKGISGAKGRVRGPAFDALWKGTLGELFEIELCTDAAPGLVYFNLILNDNHF